MLVASSTGGLHCLTVTIQIRLFYITIEIRLFYISIISYIVYKYTLSYVTSNTVQNKIYIKCKNDSHNICQLCDYLCYRVTSTIARHYTTSKTSPRLFMDFKIFEGWAKVILETAKGSTLEDPPDILLLMQGL